MQTVIMKTSRSLVICLTIFTNAAASKPNVSQSIIKILCLHGNVFFHIIK